MQPIYKDASQTLDARLADLISRMTLEEKVGQLMQLDGRIDLEDVIPRQTPGSFLHILGDDVNRAIDLSLQTRLGIPPLIAEDCIHGHSFWKGATIFPTQLALSCSWNPQVLEDVARVTAKEARPTGIHWTFSPVLCITRDLRWGRVDETFGEDPHLIGELGAAMIRGYQGNGLHDPEGMLATAKHYAGYSETQGGRDASEADITPRKLRSYFFPPFEKAARNGCMTFMTGYQSMEGVPSTANKWLLNDVLKDEWGFEGIVVTDWDNVGRMHWEQKICPSMKEAAALAVKSGNDLMMQTPTFFEGALEAVAAGMLTEQEIEEPCRRVLALKFRMGLFENPRRADLTQAAQVVGTEEHRAINLDVARQSLVLLRNEGALPLEESALRRIAVIGPNADNDLDQLGDWSLGSSQHTEEKGKHPRECTITVLDGIRSRAPHRCEVTYTKGCSVMTPETDDIAEAVELADSADATVVVVGDQIPLVGEFLSTATLELQGGQLALLDALSKTGKPLIVVLINSKPLVLPPTVQNAAAIIEAFNPGMQGGQAIAELIFGDLNPSGKLTTSFPYHVGQQPVYYSQVRGQHGERYADLTQEPLFAFGHGLSYTTYEYSNLRVLTPELNAGDTTRIEVDVANTGQRGGNEIVQVYVGDEVTSATWVQMELKAFERIHLEAGQSRTLSFSVPFEAFSMVNAAGQRVVEPGNFQVWVGPSSRKAALLEGKVTVVA
jgi:beta-glucosidase